MQYATMYEQCCWLIYWKENIGKGVSSNKDWKENIGWYDSSRVEHSWKEMSCNLLFVCMNRIKKESCARFLFCFFLLNLPCVSPVEISQIVKLFCFFYSSLHTFTFMLLVFICIFVLYSRFAILSSPPVDP